MRDVHSTEFLEFAAYPVPIHARLDMRMTPLIASLLKGWSVSVADDLADSPKLELLASPDHGMTVRGRWVGQDYTVSDPVDGACSFIAEALKVQANDASDSFCVHSAAAILCGRAVLFAAGFRAGKSTLTTVLASRGVRIMADDAVFISPEVRAAISPGISPRLRLPLPADLAHHTRNFVRETMRLTGKRYGYLALPDNRLMANGEQAPIGAFVHLNRRPGGRAVLVEIPKSEALKTLIWQNFARQIPAGRILAGLSDLVASRPTLELQYSSAEDAADLLESTFSAWPDDAVPVAGDDLFDEEYQLNIDNPRWRTKPNIVEKRLDAGHFIADEDTGRIFQLNSTAAAIWRMLSAGEDPEDVASLMCTAFPEIGSERISNDVVALIQCFRENDLLFRA